MYSDNFKQIFDTHRNPDHEVVHIFRRAALSVPDTNHYFSRHKYHKNFGICFCSSPDEPDCAIWLFGDGPREWQRYEKLANNEDCAQMMEILYRIYYETVDETKRGKLADHTSNYDNWGADSGWYPAYVMAKAELTLELGRMLMSEYEAEEVITNLEQGPEG